MKCINDQLTRVKHACRRQPRRLELELPLLTFSHLCVDGSIVIFTSEKQNAKTQNSLIQHHAAANELLPMPMVRGYIGRRR